MAIDTETKRRSVHHVLPVADASIGAEDRRVVMSGYWFAAAAAATIVARAAKTLVLSSKNGTKVLSSRNRTKVLSG